MRLSKQAIETIRHIVQSEAGTGTSVRLFGSRLDDNLRGGDLDLLIELKVPARNPARLAARIEARVSRALGGRSVDALLTAPNLHQLPIHEIARSKGRLL